MGQRAAPAADDVTEIPRLEGGVEEVAQDPPGSGDEEAAGASPRPRRRREPQVADLAADGPDPARSDSVTQTQLVKAFYWLYRGWCRLLGSAVDAHYSDFEDLAGAWIDLARKVPGIRWIILAAGPLFTLTDLIDKLAKAWEVRTRWRRPFSAAGWRQRPQAGGDPDLQAVDGGTGAP